METQSSTPSHTNDERTLAALAHAGAILNFVLGGVGGLIAAGAIWLVQKEKSQWVAYHALQSLVFQILQIAAAILIVGVPWAIGFAFSFLTLGLGTIIAVPIMIVLLFAAIAGGFACLVYSLYGAYQLYEGREFKIKWVGDWVEGQMQKPPPPPA